MSTNLDKPTTFREKINERRKNDVVNLKNWYVRSLLTKGTCLKSADIPNSLVECKRAHILLKRAIAERRKN